jgi:hypothetical protein
MELTDDLSEFPTREYIVSFLQSRGCTYKEHLDSRGQTVWTFRYLFTGQECTHASYRTDAALRWEILKCASNVFGISLDR